MLIIGPAATRTGELLLDIDNDSGTITNLTLRYDPDITPRDFALKAVRNTMQLSKPYFPQSPSAPQDLGAGLHRRQLLQHHVAARWDLHAGPAEPGRGSSPIFW